MRLSIVLGSLAGGGAERTGVYLAEYGVKHGWQVDIVTLCALGFYDVPEGCNRICLDQKIAKGNIFKRAKHLIKRRLGFGRYVRKNKPDVIFCVLSGGLVCTYGIGRKIPVIGSERSNPRYKKNKKDIFIRNFLFKSCDGMIYQTQAAMDYYKETCGLSGIVIPNAIGNPIAYEFDKPCEEREKKIVAMGRLVPEKDYETMLDAFEIVYAKHPDYRLDIYGAGPRLDTLKEYTEKLNASGAINFMGATQEALREMYNGTCYVMSSISEGMPNALMEAMAIGLPCVSSDCPNGPSDLIVSGENGILVEMKNPEQMAEAINRYIEDKEFADKIAANGIKIKETNSIDVICKRFFDYFVSFIEK